MNIDTIKSMLRIADPANNAPAHERRSALTMAQREMDKQGWSYASLGFSQEDAERIANQFAVAFGKPQAKNNKKENHPISLFRSRRTNKPSSNTQAGRVPFRKPNQDPPGESYFDQLEREDNEKFDQWYRSFVAGRARQRAQEVQEDRYVSKVVTVVMVALTLIVVLFFIFAEVM